VVSTCEEGRATVKEGKGKRENKEKNLADLMRL
jgi:hypothetical protein